MSAEELREALSKFTLESDKVIEVNEELEAAYIEVWNGEEESTVSEEQRADIRKTTQECEQKLEEVEGILHKALWERFGQPTTFFWRWKWQKRNVSAFQLSSLM